MCFFIKNHLHTTNWEIFRAKCVLLWERRNVEEMMMTVDTQKLQHRTTMNHEKIIRIWNSNHPTPVPTRHKLSTLSNRLPSHTVDKHSFPYPSRRWRLPVVKSFDFPHISNEQRKPHSREIVIITRRCGKSLTIFLVSLFFVL